MSASAALNVSTVHGVTSLLEHTAATWPAAPAVTCGGVTQNWFDTARRCRNLAAAFERLGVQRGARIACLGFNSLEHFELFFAPARIGAILVPINFRLARREMIECLQDAEPALLIIDDDHLDSLEPLTRACPSLRAVVHTGRGPTPAGVQRYAALAEAGATPKGRPSGGDDTLALFYTGGTTGRAKGVMLSHTNLLANAGGSAPLYEMRQRETYLLASPLFHVAAGSRIQTAALMGAHTVILPHFDAGMALQAIEAHRINCLQLVPTTLRMLLEHPDLDRRQLASLRMISYGAAPMPVALLQQALERLPGVRFFQSYGMTECSPVITVLDAEDHQLTGDYHARLGSVGRPVPYVEIRVLDDSGRPAATNETGEIVVRGANVMSGYWRAPVLTDRALRDGWYHTGDGGYFDEAGYLVLAGRIKDMIISGGENVYPIEIENLLSRHPAVQECAVIGVPDDKWGETVHAVVRLRPAQTADSATLLRYCREHLAHYKCPTGVTFRSAPMPLSSVNKILKSELKRQVVAARQA